MGKNKQRSGLLVVVRHGESTWNRLGKWTGLTDVELTSKGRSDARLIGEQLRDIKFDVIYTSALKRAHETLAEILKTYGKTSAKPIASAVLNERDYGDYTGKNKWEVKTKVGDKMFEQIRRGYDTDIPHGENLHMVYDRAVPFYKKVILPQLLRGENVLIVSHGNTIRALEKYLDNLTDKQIESVEMPFSDILLYTVDNTGRAVTKELRQIDIAPSNA